MKRIHNAFIATALACSLAVTPVFAAPSEADLKKQKSAAEQQVSSLQSQLTDLMAKINQLENDMVAKGEEITQAEADLKAAQEKEDQQQEDMKLRIKYMYEEGDGSALERILSSGSIAEMLNQADYIKSVHEYDRKMLEEYVKTKQQVADLKDTLETEMKNLETMQADYEKQQKTLSATLESKQAEVADLDKQLQEAAAEAARKAAEEAAKQAAAAANNSNRGNSNSGNTSNGGTNSGNTNTGNTTVTPTPAAPSNNSSAASTIVSAAYSQLGVPYVWGGTTPGVGLDCSGLTQYCHRVAGISIPRTSSAQLAGGTIVSNPQPGDICWTPGHVAIYTGGGQMIEAQQTGVPVCVSSVRVTYYVRYW